MFQHPYLMFAMVHDHHRLMRAAADRSRLRTAVLGGARRHAHHGRSARAASATVLTIAGRPVGSMALPDATPQ
jgi:hypothetical protein